MQKPTDRFRRLGRIVGLNFLVGKIVFVFAPLICTAAWLLAALNVTGIWLDCIPSSSLYPCRSQAVAWRETLASIVAPALLTLIVCAEAHRLNNPR